MDVNFLHDTLLDGEDLIEKNNEMLAISGDADWVSIYSDTEETLRVAEPFLHDTDYEEEHSRTDYMLDRDTKEPVNKGELSHYRGMDDASEFAP